MQKNNSALYLKGTLVVLCSSLILSACQLNNSLSGQPVANDALNLALNPISKGEQLNPISKGEQLNPISKGEQLNPISKGEQLNPGSKGERFVQGTIELSGVDHPLANQELQFILNGQPVPSEWVELRASGNQTLQYIIQKLPFEGIHILEIQYPGQVLSTMVPPEAKQLTLDLRSSLIVDTVRFANATEIITFAQWTPELLNALINAPEIDPLLATFQQESTELTPTALSNWLAQETQQNNLRTTLDNLNNLNSTTSVTP